MDEPTWTEGDVIRRAAILLHLVALLVGVVALVSLAWVLLAGCAVLAVVSAAWYVRGAAEVREERMALAAQARHARPFDAAFDQGATP